MEDNGTNKYGKPFQSISYIGTARAHYKYTGVSFSEIILLQFSNQKLEKTEKKN
jgi:hypothetical protein